LATATIGIAHGLGADRASAAPPAPGASAAAALVARALGRTPMLEDLRELCDRIGGRPTGSPPLDRAVEWGAAKLRAAGVASVALESFTVPRLWLGDRAEATSVSPVAFPLRVASAPYSPSTPPGGLEAPLVDAGAGAPADYERLG